MAFSTATFYSYLAGAPLVAEVTFELSPAALGFCMGTITAGFAIGSFLSERYATRFPLTTMMIAGRIAACAGLVAGLFLADFEHVLSLFGATIFAGFGNGLTMPSANTGAMSVRPGLTGSAAGLAGALTIGGGAVLSAITGAIISMEYGIYQLLGMMLFCALAGLGAALYVRRVERLDAKECSDTAG